MSSMARKHYDIESSVALVGLFRDFDKIFGIVALPYNKAMCLGKMTGYCTFRKSSFLHTASSDHESQWGCLAPS